MAKTTKKEVSKNETEVELDYAVEEGDLEAVKRYMERRKKNKSDVGINLKHRDDGVAELSYTHKDQRMGNLLLKDSLATADTIFLDTILCQLSNAANSDGDRADQVNFMLSVIKGIEPQDQLETLLAAQMATIHNLAMKYARILNGVDTIPQQDSAEKTLNKLNRTFIAQMAALKKYRTGGEQKVKVEHVHVHEGGQAVVGDVSHTTNQGVS